MSENTEAFAALDKLIGDNAALKEGLLNLQREASAAGLTTEEYSEKVVGFLKGEGIEVTPEVMLAILKHTGFKLTDEQLGQVSGGWGSHDCNKWKDCGNGMGRTCHPHC